MKTTLAVAVLLFGGVAISNLLAQGTFVWGNNQLGVRSPVYGVPPAGTPPDQVRTGNTSAGTPPGTQTYAGALLNGTSFTAAIYVGRTASEVMVNNTTPQMGGTTSFRTGGGVGLTPAINSVADNIPGGTPDVAYQMRAWDNRNMTVTSWTQVMAAGGQIAAGASDIAVFTAPLGGGTFTSPLTLGLRSFQLTQVVPEPSLIALGALGLGALLLRRRK